MSFKSWSKEQKNKSEAKTKADAPGAPKAAESPAKADEKTEKAPAKS